MGYLEEKSHVGMESRMCVVFGKQFDTGALLLDRRLKETLDHHHLVGWGFCPEAQEKLDEGFVALVAVDADKSDRDVDGTITPDGAYRLGPIAWVRTSVAKDMFNVPIKDVCFCEIGVIEYLEKLEKKLKK